MKKLSTIFVFVAVLSILASSLIGIGQSSVFAQSEDGVSKTLGFTTTGEDAFYKFRVPGGGMECQGKIRYYFQDGRQISTIKPVGTECYAVSMKVDAGNGYSPWTNAYNGEFVKIDTDASVHFENILYRLCSLPAGTTQAVCTKVHRARYYAPPYWTLGKCYEKQPLITTTYKQNHPCVKYIQDALKQDNYWPGQVDGIYGPKTEAAVKRFQADPRHNPVITADGKFGPQTWSKFINTYGYFTE